MNSRATWALDAKLLDALVRNLRTVASSDELREYEVALLPSGAVDAHASAYARAYRVKAGDGSYTCLRFWLNTAPKAILETYTALQRSPSVYRGCGISHVRIVDEAINVDGTAVPAVLMDWVEGSALADAVTANLTNSSELVRVAEALRSTFVALNEQRTSHGDLRSSNILTAIERRSLKVGLIDLDSIRWPGGPTAVRPVGGNDMWKSIWQRDRVSMLESDYLDQAVTYLTVVLVAADRGLWRGPTDGFLTFKHLRADSDEVWRRLNQMKGTPARLATAVRRVTDKAGHWADVAEALRDTTGVVLTERTFWDAAIEGRGARVSVRAPPPPPPSPPTPRPKPIEPMESGVTVQSGDTNKWPPWLWIAVLLTIAVITALVYWWKVS
jgi:hypothetical protein